MKPSDFRLLVVVLLGMIVILLALDAKRASAHTITKPDCRAYAAVRSLTGIGLPRRHYKQCRSLAAKHVEHHCADTVRTAIRCVFGSRADEAITVARCESGLSTRAVGPNDEYGNPRLGLFQLGTYERSKSGLYDSRSSATVQAKSAFNWFVATGSSWRAWECKA